MQLLHEPPGPMDLGEKYFRPGSKAGTAVDKHVERLILEGRIEGADDSHLVTKLFAIPKAEKDAWRIIHNLVPLNVYCARMKFKMEGIEAVKYLLREGDWMCKIDLKDAFYHIPIAPEFRKYFQFRWKGMILQWTVLYACTNGLDGFPPVDGTFCSSRASPSTKGGHPYRKRRS